jgi:hypothetical protein
VAHPQIAAFARLANGAPSPTRVISGQGTKLSRTMHDIRYVAKTDEFVVTNPFAQAILTFRGAATGEEPPVRTIHGPRTRLMSPDRTDVDEVHDEILVAEGSAIFVYPRRADGDIAPIRAIEGPLTQLRGAQALAVDPVHNVIVVNSRVGEHPALLIFNRTDNGNVAPRGVIAGPKTGMIRFTQLQIYAPGGWIVATMPGVSAEREPKNSFVGIWSIRDNGDVPPRWKIGGPKSTLKKPRGVALDPAHNEIIVADMRLNAVLTYVLPELFESGTRD